MELADALASHVLKTLPRRLPATGVMGEKLIYEGPITAPDGRHPWIRSIWQVEADGTARLISAVPLRLRS